MLGLTFALLSTYVGVKVSREKGNKKLSITWMELETFGLLDWNKLENKKEPAQWIRTRQRHRTCSFTSKTHFIRIKWYKNKPFTKCLLQRQTSGIQNTHFHKLKIGWLFWRYIFFNNNFFETLYHKKKTMIETKISQLKGARTWHAVFGAENTLHSSLVFP